MRNEKVSERWKVRYSAWFLALFFVVMQIQSPLLCQASWEAEEKTGTLYARSAVLMDGKTGRVLLGKEEDVPHPMASTTKILTCILALEEGEKDAVVSVSKNAQKQPKVHAGIMKNEQYFLEDLLYSLMLESHNDSAVAIAEHIGGSVEEFAEMMNEKAEEIGCTAFHFITPNGLDAEDELGAHRISAKDLGLIMSYCAWESPESEAFLKITQTRSYSFQEITGKRTISCTNHNALLDMVEGAVTGKTGFTGEAGYCYVGAVERDGRRFVVSLLACGWPNHKTYKWSDAKQLLNYGTEHYFYEDIWQELEENSISVEDGIGGTNPLFDDARMPVLVDTGEKKLEILKAEDEETAVEITMEEEISAPVKKGEKVGKITYYIEEKEVAAFDICTAESMQKKDYAWTAKEIFMKYLNPISGK